MPMTDVVAQPESELPHWAALRNKKLRSKLLRHDRLKPSRLAGWWTTGRLGGQDIPKITLRRQDRKLPFFPLRPPCGLPVGGGVGGGLSPVDDGLRAKATTGAKHGSPQTRFCPPRESESGVPGASPTAIDLPIPRRQTPLPRVGSRSFFFFFLSLRLTLLGARGRGLSDGFIHVF